MTYFSWISTSKDFSYIIRNETSFASVEKIGNFARATIYRLTAGGVITERGNRAPFSQDFYNTRDAKNWARHFLMDMSGDHKASPERYICKSVGYVPPEPLYN